MASRFLRQGITSAKRIARSQRMLIYDQEFFDRSGIQKSNTFYDPIIHRDVTTSYFDDEDYPSEWPALDLGRKKYQEYMRRHEYYEKPCKRKARLNGQARMRQHYNFYFLALEYSRRNSTQAKAEQRHGTGMAFHETERWDDLAAMKDPFFDDDADIDRMVAAELRRSGGLEDNRRYSGSTNQPEQPGLGLTQELDHPEDHEDW